MTWKTRFALTLIMSALFVSSALAQDATATSTRVPTQAAPAATVEAETTEAAVPAVTEDATIEAAPLVTEDATAEVNATAEATAEARPVITHIIVTPQDFPAPTDDETETTVGAITLIHPKTWFAVQSPDGKTLLTNVDLFSMPADAEMPTNTVLAQVQIFSMSQLPADMGKIEYATDVLAGLPIPDGQPVPKISEVEVSGVVLARGDFSQPGNESILYVRLLDDDTFLLAIAGSITEGDVIKNEEVFQKAVASITINYEAPFPEDVSARYGDIPRSTSPEGFPQLGNADAPVTIVEIGSFDCPHCRDFHDVIFPVLLERIQAGEVLFTYVPVFGTGSLPGGQQAAVAALCADQQGKFWEYYDGLFSWQDFGTTAFIDARLKSGAATLELDTDAFDTCLDAQSTISTLQNSVTFVQGLAAFNGTPTVLLNGEQVEWGQLPTLIDAALAAPAATVEATAETDMAATAEVAATVEATAETNMAATVEATAEMAATAVPTAKATATAKP